MPKIEPNKRDDKRPAVSLIAIALFVFALTFFGYRVYDSMTSPKSEEVKYTTFLDAVDADSIATVEFSNTQIAYTLREDEGKPKSAQTIYSTPLMPYLEITQLAQDLHKNNVEFTGVMPQDTSGSFILTWVVMPILLFFIYKLLMRFVSKQNGGSSGGFGIFGNVGKSKAKVYMEKETGVTFRDVAGQDEAKESVVEILDFLNNPQKYTAIGAKLPKGALLVGSPGTGKTLLAKAVAGEAHVPFFSISGSDFIEMFAGVGASRVRDLFQEASKVAPAIIFIDEIDAIGRSRDAKFGADSEREQTLNQLLAEIDGFDSSKGVVILAATNRPEILDKALLRPGRFDRRIIVDRPNLEGRYQTLLVHTRSIRMADDVDLRKIAQATVGAVGADLANIVNEAALRAVRLGRHSVNQEDLLTSFEVVIAGTEKKGTMLTDAEKRLVAYHEVGHALV
ncbi:MAG: ATP-dependent metallopeptidase FtsH/Yme1/Tma family protein, partial [Oscillospiraceae bacterium]|nr:ATP-dependent metallopeptidase FtsH/Yme1/Tma family protein [Oscillospiraceae bacterium]